MWGGDDGLDCAGVVVGGRCLDTPELSASRMVESSAERAGPGDGVRRPKSVEF